MKMTVFQAEKGDGLLLTSADGRTLLIDGGMPAAYAEHLAPTLTKLGRLDAVSVSHIDQDHIGGVLAMVDDLFAWRVHDYQQKRGNDRHPKPAAPRPPTFPKIWHNAFHELVAENAGEISEMLAAKAGILSGGLRLESGARYFFREAMSRHADLAQSTQEALRLARRIGEGQLGIKVNPEFGGKLMLRRPNAPLLKLGKVRLSVIGPSEEDLKKLRREWNDWLKGNGSKMRKLRSRAQEDERSIGTTDVEALLRPLVEQAATFGDRSKVTTPNLASLMFLARERDRSLLLTGDGHWEDILKGLEETGVVRKGAGLHVDVLKAQHHGSEHNFHADFCRRVTAGTYVFCGNGEHANPDIRVVEMVVESRVGPKAKKSPNPEVDRPFTLWFNYDEKNTDGDERARQHMRKLAKAVKALQKAAGSRLRVKWQQSPAETLAI